MTDAELLRAYHALKDEFQTVFQRVWFDGFQGITPEGLRHVASEYQTADVKRAIAIMDEVKPIIAEIKKRGLSVRPKR